MLHSLLLVAITAGIGLASLRDDPQGAPGCTITPYEGEGSVSEFVTDLRGGADCGFVIHADLPLYQFHLVADAKLNVIRRIEVSVGNRKTQTLVVDPDLEPPYRDAEYFGSEDLNFDGYNDIKLLAWWGVTGNKGYICWLFDPKKNVFVKNEELSQLSNPTPDAVLKTITSSGVGGMAGKIYGTSTYRFDDRGALILIREEKQDWDDNRKCFVRTIKERRDGRMVVVSTEIVKQNRLPRRWRSWTSTPLEA